MNVTKNKIFISCLVVIFLGLYYYFSSSHIIRAVYITMQHEPHSTMTVMWITPSHNTNDSVYYKQKSSEEWANLSGTHNEFTEGSTTITIHCTELTGLKPNTTYIFKIFPYSKEYTFRTLPEKLDEPLTFAVGGDVYRQSLDTLRQTNLQVRKLNPAFVLLGGDITYAVSKNLSEPEDVSRWITFLQVWGDEMHTSDGRLIPVIATTSNSDTKGSHGKTSEQARCFYAFFRPLEKKGYMQLDFGNYLSLWLLDSGHTTPIEGEQSDWLRSSLESRKNMPHKIAAYHIPAYPSYRPETNIRSTLVRDTWVPIFDEYGMHVSFEHHEHAYKRTYPLKNGKIDPKGMLFLGDGAYGISDVRTPTEKWYIAYTVGKRHFYAVTLTEEGRLFRAIDENGNVFDQVISGH
jgi:hypothetical protein